MQIKNKKNLFPASIIWEVYMKRVTINVQNKAKPKKNRGKTVRDQQGTITITVHDEYKVNDK